MFETFRPECRCRALHPVPYTPYGRRAPRRAPGDPRCSADRIKAEAAAVCSLRTGGSFRQPSAGAPGTMRPRRVPEPIRAGAPAPWALLDPGGFLDAIGALLHCECEGTIRPRRVPDDPPVLALARAAPQSLKYPLSHRKVTHASERAPRAASGAAGERSSQDASWTVPI